MEAPGVEGGNAETPLDSFRLLSPQLQAVYVTLCADPMWVDTLLDLFRGSRVAAGIADALDALEGSDTETVRAVLQEVLEQLRATGSRPRRGAGVKLEVVEGG